jgi:transposase
MQSDEVLKMRIEKVLPMLNENQRRVYLAAEAESIGWGGKTKVASLSNVSRKTIAKGANKPIGFPETGIRKKGGGRKKLTEHHPELLKTIEDIVAPHTMGDPVNPLIWTSKSIRNITKALHGVGYDICHEVVRKCLKELGYNLQSNKKTKEGGDNPDRDAQFEFINARSKDFISCKDPVISVDCRKKELIGEYKNNGQEWTKAKNPTEVNVYDFIDKTNGKASPYGVYDIQNNSGWVNVGTSSDTAAFAVSTIRDWWNTEGQGMYQLSRRLYINADGGGSNGSRNNLWKAELQNLCNETGLTIHVSHFPPGTSKWNKIEHRLFAYISKNWRAKPLTSLRVIVSLIVATTTEKGLTVKAKLDDRKYETGIKISKQEKDKINIARNDFHGEWNYVIKPNS